MVALTFGGSPIQVNVGENTGVALRAAALSLAYSQDAAISVPFDLRSDLLIAPGADDGMSATVAAADSGTHTAVSGEVALGGASATVGDPIPNEGRYTRVSGAWLRTGDSDRQGSAAQAANATLTASQYNSISYEAQRFGFLTAPATTTTVASNYYSAIVPLVRIPAGMMLDTFELPIGIAGTTPLDLALVSINSDASAGTLVTALDSQSITTTGDSVPVLARVGGQQIVTAQDVYVSMRRPGVTTAPRMNYVASGAGLTRTASGAIGTGTALANVNLAYPIKVNGTMVRKSTDNYNRINQLEEAVGARNVLSYSQGSDPAARVASYSNTGSHIFPASPIRRTSEVLGFRLKNVTTIGLFEVALWSPSGSSVVPQYVFTLFASALGENLFVAGTHFPLNMRVDEGWRHSIRPAGGGAQMVGTSGQGGNYLISTNVPQVGQTYALTAGTQSLDFEIILESVPLPLSTLLNEWGERHRGHTVSRSELFTGGAGTTPSGWTLNGWAVDANKRLASPATGGTSSMAYATVPKYATRNTTGGHFIVGNATTGWIGIGGDDGTMMVRANFSTQAIEVCNWSGVGTSVTVVMTIPFADDTTGSAFASAPGTVTGRRYVFKVKRRWGRFSYYFADTVTGEKMRGTHMFRGLQRITGNRGFIFGGGSGVAGDILLDRAEFGYGVGKEIHTLFVGDSIFEGLTMSRLGLLDDFGGKNAGTFAQAMDGIRNRGDTVTVAKGGINSTDGRTAMNDFLTTHYNAGGSVKNAVVMLGTNDTVQATVDTQLAGIVSDLIARGIKVFLCTIPPSGSLYPTINANIRGKVYGDARVIDANSVLTGGTGTIWVSAYNSGDNVHPSRAGHAAVLSVDSYGRPIGQMVRDAPELFEDAFVNDFAMAA